MRGLLLTTLLAGLLTGCPGGPGTGLPAPSGADGAWSSIAHDELPAQRAAYLAEVRAHLGEHFQITDVRFFRVLRNITTWDMWRHAIGDPQKQQRKCTEVFPRLSTYQSGWMFLTCPDLPAGELLGVYLSNRVVDGQGHPLMASMRLKPGTPVAFDPPMPPGANY